MTGMVLSKLAALSQNHRPFLLLLSAYIAITGILIAYFPPFSGPNEVLHYEYIALMRQTGQLPDLATSFRADERHQPPVYYTVATLASLPFPTPPLDDIFTPNPHFVSTHRGNLNPYIHLPTEAVVVATAARVASLLFGVLALVALYGAANYTLPRGVSLLVVSLTAFQPTFLQLSSTINNDLAVTAVATLLVTYTIYLMARQKTGSPFLFWGVLLALALLSKASAIFLILLLPLACLSIWQRHKSIWPAIQSGLWGIAGFVPLYGAWLTFNHIRSGDALGLAPSVPIRALFTLRPADFPEIIPFIPELFRSFWLDWSPGIVGYGPDWLYGVMAFLLLIGLAGWFKRSDDLAQPQLITLAHLLWFGGLAAAFLAVKTLMVVHSGSVVPEGRWLLPAWPSLAWLVGVGWARWWPAAQRSVAWGGIKTVVYPLTAILLLIFLLPHLYPRPPP
jgi:4-amino-4-deoxy-L-arabinose transferase-like glycosyltransferase